MRALLLALLLFLSGPAAVGPASAQSTQQAGVFSLKTASPELKARVEKLRDYFIMYGHRFDEAPGTILSAKTKAPLTSKEVEEFLAEIEKSTTLGILERMNALLSKQDLTKPLSPQVASQLKALAGTQKVGLPPSLLKLLEGTGTVAAKTLAADVESAYLESTRYFDGQEIQGKTSVLGSQTSGPQYFDDSEKKLGEKLQVAVAAHLAKNPVGAELLKKFAGKSGSPELPAMLVLKTHPNDGAFYSSYNKALVVNTTYIVDQIAARAPPAGREALKKKLADPKQLAAYLLADPKALADFVADNDVLLVHELTHAVQDRRGKIDELMNAGTLPGADVLEWEYEAFIEENRYLHQKLLSDPATAVKSGYFSYYTEMLKDFDRWREGITQTYLQTWPEAAANWKSVEDLRQTRLAAANKLALKNIFSQEWYKFEIFKTMRITNAAADLKTEQAVYGKYLSKFVTEEYPKMRVEGFLALAKVCAAERTYDQAFYACGWASACATSAKLSTDITTKTQAAHDAAAATARSWLNHGDGAKRPAAERDVLRAELKKWAKTKGKPDSWADQ